MGAVVRHMTKKGRVGDLGRGVWASRLCPQGNSGAGMAARWHFLHAAVGFQAKPSVVLGWFLGKWIIPYSKYSLLDLIILQK